MGLGNIRQKQIKFDRDKLFDKESQEKSYFFFKFIYGVKHINDEIDRDKLFDKESNDIS